MHRIDTEGAAGVWSNGNPALGQTGTLMDAAFMQDMQDNICHAIEQAGIALAKGDIAQLYEAIVAIATGAAGAGGGAVPTGRKVLGGGLVEGGGDLTGDRTLSVVAAAVAEVLAGKRDDAAITPAALAAAIGAPDGESFALPGGRIVKEGSVGGTLYAGVATINFATPFPTTCRKVMFTPVNSTGSAARDTWIQLVSRNKAGFTYCVQTSATGGNDTLDGLDWEATGY